MIDSVCYFKKTNPLPFMTAWKSQIIFCYWQLARLYYFQLKPNFVCLADKYVEQYKLFHY